MRSSRGKYALISLLCSLLFNRASCCSREALVAGAVGYNVDNLHEGVPRGKLGHNNAGNLSPTSLKSEDADPAFWVPASVTSSTAAVQQQVSNTTEESAPPTPTSPTGSLKSNTLSLCSTTSVPIARSDKHVVLAMHPSRPRVSSMNAKLDHTKIDMTLYRSVSKCIRAWASNMWLSFNPFGSKRSRSPCAQPRPSTRCVEICTSASAMIRLAACSMCVSWRHRIYNHANSAAPPIHMPRYACCRTRRTFGKRAFTRRH